MQVPEHERPECEYSVFGRMAEVDTARLIEIAHGRRDVSDLEAQMDALHEELGIEHEVVAVDFERNRLEHSSPIGSEAAMPFAEILAREHILDDGQAPVREVLGQGHAASESFTACTNAVSENDVADTEAQDVNRRGNDSCVVLVVRVKHDHMACVSG